jgi:hypothetical protein
MADLRQLSRLLAALGSVCGEDVLERLDALDNQTGRFVRQVLERAPVEVVHLVGAVGRRAAKLQDKPRIVERISAVGFDPRSFAEASEALSKMDHVLSSDPELGRLVDDAIDELVERRVLGLLTLSKLYRFLAATKGRPGLLRRTSTGLVIADEAVHRDELRRVADSYKVHEADWVDRALRAAGATIEAPDEDEEADPGVGVARSVGPFASSSAGPITPSSPPAPGSDSPGRDLGSA